jgi:hypothetical protein
VQVERERQHASSNPAASPNTTRLAA